MSDIRRETQVTVLEPRNFKVCDGCGKEVQCAQGEYSYPDWFRLGHKIDVLDACSEECAVVVVHKLAAVAVTGAR